MNAVIVLIKHLNLLEQERPGLGLTRKENTAKWIVSLMVRMRRKVIMIQCCLCNIWFHVECVMVTKTKGVTDRIVIEDIENNKTTTGSSSTAENLGIAHQPTDQSSLQCQTTELPNEQPEDTESQDPKSTSDSEEVENYEDDIVTNSVCASDKSDTEGNVDGNIDDLNDGVVYSSEFTFKKFCVRIFPSILTHARVPHSFLSKFVHKIY